MKRTLTVLALLVGLAGCGTDDGVEGESSLPTTDTMTAEQQRARRDSAVAESGLPGSGAVGQALDAAATANRRTETMDSLAE